MWRTSSRSESGNCVEAAGGWRTSSAFQIDACVEVAAPGSVLVRDSKDPDGPVLRFSPAEWAAFTTALRRA